MNVAEKINKQVRRLPEQTQSEVLDFVEYLLAKAERQQVRREEQEWSRTSVSLAMRGMEDENGPEYTAEDLEERFSSS
jgi:anaerobic ribonucleoside-triphosphate reductase